MSDWKPIETAPKDGLLILGFAIVDSETGNWKIRIISHDRYAEVGMRQHWSGWGDSWIGPTHWMPLPAPPHSTHAERLMDAEVMTFARDCCDEDWSKFPFTSKHVWRAGLRGEPLGRCTICGKLFGDWTAEMVQRASDSVKSAPVAEMRDNQGENNDE